MQWDSSNLVVLSSSHRSLVPRRTSKELSFRVTMWFFNIIKKFVFVVYYSIKICTLFFFKQSNHKIDLLRKMYTELHHFYYISTKIVWSSFEILRPIWLNILSFYTTICLELFFFLIVDVFISYSYGEELREYLLLEFASSLMSHSRYLIQVYFKDTIIKNVSKIYSKVLFLNIFEQPYCQNNSHSFIVLLYKILLLKSHCFFLF